MALTKKELDARAINTALSFRILMEKSMKILEDKNRERNDCWRGVGLRGAFLEIRSMFFRLRTYMWDTPIPPICTEAYEKWKKEVENSLEDLRNFTLLAELSLNEDNIEGKGYDREYDD